MDRPPLKADRSPSRWATLRRDGARLSARLSVAVLVVGLTACSTAGSGVAPNRADRTFVADMVAQHHLGMRILDDAVERSDGVELRRLAFEMQGYHTRDLDLLERRRRDWKLGVPLAFPGYVSDQRLATLASITGTAHDIAWLDVMIEHHEGAAHLSEIEKGRGVDSDLRALAVAIRAVQRAEIEQMTQLRSELIEGR